MSRARKGLDSLRGVAYAAWRPIYQSSVIHYHGKADLLEVKLRGKGVFRF